MYKQITSWSFSRYSDYKQCPLKAKLKYIDRIKEPPSPAMERGTAIHSLAENFIKGQLVSLPPELKNFAGLFRRLRKGYNRVVDRMLVEENLAFTRDWRKTVWNDWAGCWLRIRADCIDFENETTALVNDWKTGKCRPEENAKYTEQLELCALGTLLWLPHIEVVKPQLVYLDHKIVYPLPEEPLIFTHGDIPKLQKIWRKRTRPMLCDKVFAPRPNDRCRYCHFRCSNKLAGGGQCKY